MSVSKLVKECKRLNIMKKGNNMGGKAISNVRRIYIHEYNSICISIMQLFPYLRMLPVKTYRSKNTFGDIDFIVQLKSGFNIKQDIINKLKLSEDQYFDNNVSFSFNYKDVQIDFNLIDSENFMLMYNYHGDGDLGNFIGRTARSINFKYGHEGLIYEKHISDHHKISVVVSRDTKKSLEFLGYDYAKWLKGFDTEEEIFDYAVSSPFFNSLYFTLNEQAHNDRVRNKKRKMYQKMLTYIQNHGLEPKPKLTEYECDEHYKRAIELFGSSFDEDVKSQIAKYERDIFIKKFFNGEIVKEITNLNGKELGEFMRKFRSDFMDIHKTSIESYTDSKLLDNISNEEVHNKINSIILNYYKAGKL